MTERRFDTGYYNDPYVMDLPMEAKFLYTYLWTNVHCNQAGLYEIALKTISWETGITQEKIPELLEILKKKVMWLPDQNLIWVKNFLHHQSVSPTFLAAAAKCLEKVANNGLVREFIDYNRERYNLSVPHLEGSDRVAVSSIPLPHAPSNSHALSELSKDGVDKGKEVEVSPEDQQIISVWRSVAGFIMELAEILDLLRKIRADFPGVNILTESRAWAARKISEPLTEASRPSGQVYNFMARRYKWDQEEKAKKSGRRKYGFCVKCHYSGPPLYKACPLCGGAYELRYQE